MPPMELLYVDELGTRPARKGKPVKQWFGETRDFEELTARFTFYTPVVYHLIDDMNRTKICTDVISHTLALAMQEHPLVITGLPRPVFRFSDSLPAAPELESFGHTLYAVPTEQWEQVYPRLSMISVTDPVTYRFCVLPSHVREIPNPIGKHGELRLRVWFFSCYGNRETYFFQDGIVRPKAGEPQDAGEVPRLCYHYPIREFVELADRILTRMAEKTRVSREEIIPHAAALTEGGNPIPLDLALRKQNELHRKIAAPLKESSLSEPIIRQYREVIRFYESTFGSSGGSAQ
jgi:hypothetical protein